MLKKEYVEMVEQSYTWLQADWTHCAVAIGIAYAACGCATFLWHANVDRNDDLGMSFGFGVLWPMIWAMLALATCGRLWRWVTVPEPWVCPDCNWLNPKGNRVCGCCEPGNAEHNQGFTGKKLWDKKLGQAVTGAGFNDAYWTVKDKLGKDHLRHGWELELLDDYLKRNPVRHKVGDRVWHKGEKAFCTVGQNFLNGSTHPDWYVVDFGFNRPGGRFMKCFSSDLEDATLLCPPEKPSPSSGWTGSISLNWGAPKGWDVKIDPSCRLVKCEHSERAEKHDGGHVTRRHVTLQFSIDQDDRDAKLAVPAGIRLGKLQIGRYSLNTPVNGSWFEVDTDDAKPLDLGDLGSRYDPERDKITKVTINQDMSRTVTLLRNGTETDYKLGSNVDLVATARGQYRLVGRLEIDVKASDLTKEPEPGVIQDMMAHLYVDDNLYPDDFGDEPDMKLAESLKPRGVTYGSQPDPMKAPASKQDVENLREAVRKLKVRLKKLEAVSHEQGVLATPEELEARKGKSELINFIKSKYGVRVDLRQIFPNLGPGQGFRGMGHGTTFC